MKSITLVLLLTGCTLIAAPLRAAETTVSVRTSDILVERPASLIGANIEDLNEQLYGGLYSQLLYGECFEEDVDPTDLLHLTGGDRMAVWVVRDEKNQPVLRPFIGGLRSRIYATGGDVDWASTENRGPKLTKVGSLTFRGGVLLPGELPGDLGAKLVSLATGDSQVSRHWRKMQSGSASGSLTLVRHGVFTGRQAQEIQFRSGTGELGVSNAGLFHEGIALAAGKPYDGLLRIKSDTAQQVFVSLRDGSGALLAEQPLELAAQPGQYQRLTFTLTPTASASAGQFALVLKQPGSITVDYAFLEPGEWGRYHGLPVRRDLAEAILSMGVKTIRYNGSMVNKNFDGATLYKWKQMIAPRDERQPYHGFFNPYASNGFSIFEFMDFSAATGIRQMIGLRIDETEQDMADLVDYCLGGADTEWGRRRIANGHPQPYALTAIEIGNEERPTPEYLARVKALAAAIWSKNRTLDVVASINVRAGSPTDFFIDLARWLRAQGQEARFILDSHYGSALNFADTVIDKAVGLTMHRTLADAVPGFNLRLWPMEENGNSCNWERGLAHAHNLNTMNRMPAFLERAGTANTLQAWDLTVFFDQGRIHFTPTQIFFQPSYYVDRMFADEWLPVVLNAKCSAPRLDVLAKRSKDGGVVTLYLANIDAAPITTRLDLGDFTPATTKVMRIGSSDLKTKNTPDEPARMTSARVGWSYDPANPVITLPGYSFTTIRLAR